MLFYFKITDEDLIQRIKDHVTVTMSPHLYRDWNASLAIDGDNRTNPDTCYCCAVSFVLGRMLMWWMIDLGMMYPIKLIQFYGRDDGNFFNSKNLSGIPQFSLSEFFAYVLY